MAKRTKTEIASPSSASRGGLQFSMGLRDTLSYQQTGSRVLTTKQIREMFQPPRTLGANEQARVALDSRLEADGCYSLLQHSLQMGMYGSMASFLGYGALQNIAQNGMIRACVETVADDMTRNWIELTREGEDNTSAEADEQIKALQEEMKRLELQKVFHEACSMTGYYGGCLLYLDTGASGQELLNPLNLDPRISMEARDKGFLKAVRVVDPINVFPGDYNSSDPLRGDYYMPRTWWVLGQQVHASRLLRIVANEAPLVFRPAYNFLGIPQAQILWDYVIHFGDNRNSANRLLNKFSTMVFKTAMADILNGSADNLNTLDARMQILVHNRSNDGVIAIDKDAEDVVKIETPLSGVTDIVRQSLEILAAMNRTPAVKLLGISPSGFNATGESDLRNYYDHIASQQEKVIRHALRTTLDIMQISLFGGVDKSIDFTFCPLSEEDKASKAMTNQTTVNTLCALLDRDVISVEEVRAALIEDPDSGLNSLDPEAIPEPSAEGMAAQELDEGHLEQEAMMGMDAAKWITVHPGGKGQKSDGTGERKGQPVLIDDETGEILGGMGGKHTGKTMKQVKKESAQESKARQSVGQRKEQPAESQSGLPDFDAIMSKKIEDMKKSKKYSLKSIDEEVKKGSYADTIGKKLKKMMEEDFDKKIAELEKQKKELVSWAKSMTEETETKQVVEQPVKVEEPAKQVKKSTKKAKEKSPEQVAFEAEIDQKIAKIEQDKNQQLAKIDSDMATGWLGKDAGAKWKKQIEKSAASEIKKLEKQKKQGIKKEAKSETSSESQPSNEHDKLKNEVIKLQNEWNKAYNAGPGHNYDLPALTKKIEEAQKKLKKLDLEDAKKKLSGLAFKSLFGKDPEEKAKADKEFKQLSDQIQKLKSELGEESSNNQQAQNQPSPAEKSTYTDTPQMAHIKQVAKWNPSKTVTGNPHISQEPFVLKDAKKGKSAQDYAKPTEELTPYEQSAAKTYTGNDYSWMNNFYRKGKDLSELTKGEKSILASMDSLFTKARTTAPLVLYRGMGLKHFDHQLKIGEVLTDKGFMSTSSSFKAAENFKKSHLKSAIFEIHAPAGSSALSLRDISKIPKEEEFLFNRGTRMKIVDVKNKYGHNVYVCEILP